MRSSVAHESEDFYAFLRGPSLLGLSSRGLDWQGFVVERHTAASGERPEAIADRYILGLVVGRPWTGEHPNGRGGFTSIPNIPGTMTLITPGIVPACSSRERCEHILCALEPSFVHGVEGELDSRPKETPWSRGGLNDPSLRQLMKLLATEANQGGPSGRLYADYLGHAVATRFLLLSTEEKRTGSRTSPLPRHLLRRILDRMEDVSADLDLRSLAAESGYSRGHFLRMFHAATGSTPHHYLLQVRLKRAQELIRMGKMSFIDIAAASGFSSHAHMSKAFRKVLNVTPSEYRRDM